MDNRELGPIVDDLHQKWVCLVIDNDSPDDMNGIEALELYKCFHWVLRAPEWGDIELSCQMCYCNGVCPETLRVSNPDIRVPNDWIGAAIALRKQ